MPCSRIARQRSARYSVPGFASGVGSCAGCARLCSIKDSASLVRAGGDLPPGLRLRG